MIAPWYALMYTPLERLAWRRGYALALHGSMARDLDLIAVPWVEDADDPQKLLDDFVQYVICRADVEIDPRKLYGEKKPHGRIAYSIHIGHKGHYLDISILPRVKSTAPVPDYMI